jgi:SAM-dependent methyltransferase
MTIDELTQIEGVFIGNGSAKFDDPGRGDIERIIQSSRKVGWRKALEGHELESYVSDENRVRPLLKALPLSPSMNVLEIGPGFGQMTGSIAKRVRHVDAIEVDMQQARFCATRAAQDGQDNIRIIAAGLDGNIPLPSDHYDLVVMNLVIEWCALRSNISHEATQRLYLREIFRVLSPKGRAFISTKNRFSLRLLTGGRDEHMGSLPFGSALPEAISRLILKKRPPGKLHSRRHFRKMLTDAGFSELQEFIAIPDMRWPLSYLPSSKFNQDHAATIANSLGRGRRAVRLLPLFLQKEFSPGLTFLVTK